MNAAEDLYREEAHGNRLKDKIHTTKIQQGGTLGPVYCYFTYHFQ